MAAKPSTSESTTEKRSPYDLPLPSKIIQLLSEEDIGGRDLLIVGDVHGCFDELKELVESNHITPKDTCVVFVGDLVNKGPKSIEVIQYVMENGWYSIRGNHDEVCLRELKLLKERDPAPEYQWVTKLAKKEQQWLSELPYVIHIPSRQIIVVHAGLVPDKPLEEQEVDAFLHMRCIKQVGSKWDWAKKFLDEEYQLWGKVWSGPEHVYFGHDARRLFQECKFATGLDTGCVYGHELTAIYPLNRKVIKVKSHQELRESKLTPK